MGFFLETLKLTDEKIVSGGWPKDSLNYPVAYVFFTNLFRRFRACELLFESGYPLEGFALIRDVKDRAFVLAAIAHNWCTFGESMGQVVGLTTTDPEYEKKITRARKNLENANSNRLVGKTSSLPPDVQDDLKKWDALFNYEVHGGFLSFTQEIHELVTNRQKPQIGPTSKYNSYVIYMNRSAEIGWLVVRILPLLQPEVGAFGEVGTGGGSCSITLLDIWSKY